jgi:hypothetical protein
MNNLTESMSALVSEFEQSGMSQKDFSSSKGMGFHKFNYWYRKLKREAYGQTTPNGFIELRADSTDQQVPVEVVYPNGVKVCLYSADLPVISSLIRIY